MNAIWIQKKIQLGNRAKFVLKVPLHVTAEALTSQTFSLPVYARYRTRVEVKKNPGRKSLDSALFRR